MLSVNPKYLTINLNLLVLSNPPVRHHQQPIVILQICLIIDRKTALNCLTSPHELLLDRNGLAIYQLFLVIEQHPKQLSFVMPLGMEFPVRSEKYVYLEGCIGDGSGYVLHGHCGEVLAEFLDGFYEDGGASVRLQ